MGVDEVAQPRRRLAREGQIGVWIIADGIGGARHLLEDGIDSRQLGQGHIQRAALPKAVQDRLGSARAHLLNFRPVKDQDWQLGRQACRELSRVVPRHLGEESLV